MVPPQARYPTGWNHPVEEISRQRQTLERDPTRKVAQLFGITLRWTNAAPQRQ